MFGCVSYLWERLETLFLPIFFPSLGFPFFLMFISFNFSLRIHHHRLNISGKLLKAAVINSSHTSRVLCFSINGIFRIKSLPEIKMYIYYSWEFTLKKTVASVKLH